ncbi:hypothetical protein Cni_G28527 [Canna indica]|uniref:Protein kinase domain-containing protein n=1 Tax=Canna indica TaxID=4628 RepID=A0AAQ3QT70_9LILI|nr:hypothetical protein Cni_G28527 [Canna indica]
MSLRLHLLPHRIPRARTDQITNPSRPRRRRDLTVLPRHDPTILVPLPLPPPSAPSTLVAPSTLAAPSDHVAPLHPRPPSSSSCQPPVLADLERLRRLGSGSEGTVWMVRHRPTARLYALKVIYGNHEDAIHRQILCAIEILRTANNPFVVLCHTMYDHSGEIQILLEFMDGGSLEGPCITSEPFLSEVAH